MEQNIQRQGFTLAKDYLVKNFDYYRCMCRIMVDIILTPNNIMQRALYIRARYTILKAVELY